MNRVLYTLFAAPHIKCLRAGIGFCFIHKAWHLLGIFTASSTHVMQEVETSMISFRDLAENSI